MYIKSLVASARGRDTTTPEVSINMTNRSLSQNVSGMLLKNSPQTPSAHLLVKPGEAVRWSGSKNSRQSKKQPNPSELPPWQCSSTNLGSVWEGFSPQGPLRGRGIFFPLPQGKPLPAGWMYSDLHQGYRWFKSARPCEDGSSLGKWHN